MKVLYVTPYIHPTYGGPGIVVREMANALIAQGGIAHVVTTNAPNLKNSPEKDGAEFIENDILFKYFNYKFPRSWFQSPSMKYWLYSQSGKYDLVHLHVPFTAPFRYGALAARASGRPYIATLHGMLDPWSLSQKSWKKIPYLILLEKDILSRAKTLHATSELEMEYLKKMKLGPAIDFLPPAVQLPTMLENFSKLENNHRIVCIARLHPVKALPVLFKALAKVRSYGINLILDLAGDGDVNYVEKLRREADILGLNGAIVWHGHVDPKIRDDLFAKSSCAILISYHENFGLAAAEALAAGVPVIVSDQVGIASAVKSYKAGKVVSVGDPASTAEAIKEVINQKNLSEYRARAHRLARELYGFANFSNSLVKIYENVIK